MFISIFYKFKPCTLLLALCILMSHFLSAQMSKASSLIPLSISEYRVKQDTIYNPSEFSGLDAADVLPKSLFKTDTTQLPTLQEVPQPSSTNIPEPEEETIDTAQTSMDIVEKVVETSFYQDSTCIDLTFDSVSIVQITDKYVEIEYSILNKGNAPAPMFGTKRSNADNVAVHFYYSGTPRLTRGAILADGIYLTENLRETKGMLAPNAVYKNKFKLSLEKKNRFYGVIILQIDVFDVMRHECDETNNIFAIVPKWY